ncbi:MAG TPA: anti-sigma factor [Steroidobacteraceae bacterium]|jgi:anti-sigma-K factor RskA|nr:anti-sigma factor [Steroidobacteraceae bacterium]
MNAPIDNEDTVLRYAEYALGVLDADERAAVEEEMARSPAAAQAVEHWQQLLTPMVPTTEEVAPPANVWARIQSTLGPRQRPRSDTGWWDSLHWWRGLALATGAATLVLLLFIVIPRHAATPPQTYLTATLQQNNGAPGWTVTVDLRGARAILVPATPLALPAGRAPELWLIPPGGRPIPVGMIARDTPSTLPLDAALLSRLSRAGTFAVSVEPPGGSPTGQPTGPVIAQGAVRSG